ncbi:MAG: hypothetical protein ACREFX_05245, partial [Opitutaceae bacterium]
VSYLVKPPTAEMVEKAFRFVHLIRDERDADGRSAGAAREPIPVGSQRVFLVLAVLGIVVAAGALIFLMFMK